MFRSRRSSRIALALGLGLAGACGGNTSSSSPGAGGGGAGGAGLAGSTGTAGAGGTSDAGLGGSIGDVPSPGSSCDQAPPPLRSSGTILELPFELIFAGQPFVYGEANAVAGQTVTPLNFRFYVSQAQLLGPGGATTPVDIVTSAGTAQPYDAFLYSAESADAQTARVLAPPGSYEGLAFVLGLSPACNMGNPSSRAFPLSADSQMTWPLGLGYLFLRYESLISGGADGGSAPLPRAIHMGGDIVDLSKPGGIAVRVTGSLSIPASGSTRKTIRVAMDQIFAGATSDVDLTGFPFASAGDEVAAGERLRRSGAGLPLFVFAP
jgi:hypothetical protein